MRLDHPTVLIFTEKTTRKQSEGFVHFFYKLGPDYTRKKLESTPAEFHCYFPNIL